MVAPQKRNIQTALIVDRDESMCNIIKRYFQNRFMKVIHVFDTGTKARECLMSGTIDVIVFDLKLKEPLGEDFYKFIRQIPHQAKTPIVLIAGHVAKPEIDICMKDTWCKPLSKPFTEELMAEILDKFERSITANGGWAALRPAVDPQVPSVHEMPQQPRKSLSATPTKRELDFGSNSALNVLPKSANDLRSPLDENQGTPRVRSRVLHTTQVLGQNVPVYAPESVMVVDNDRAVHSLLKNYLKDYTENDVRCFGHARDASKSINQDSYDLIIMDWRLKELTGLGLYNRIRHGSLNHKSPVLVLSGFAYKEDARILRENQATGFVEKPLVKKQFDDAVKQILTTAAEYEAAEKYIGEVTPRIREDKTQVLQFISKLMVAPKDAATYLNIFGQQLLKDRCIYMAELAFQHAMLKDRKNLMAMTELSKIYQRTNRFDKAAQLLKNACHLSPDSIERLCLLGECNLSMANAEEAKRYFKMALSIDEDNIKANAGLTVSQNFIDQPGHQSMQGTGLSSQLASSLNSVAIAYVKDKAIEKAIEQYKAALCFIYDSETLAKVNFNLGMAMLRKGKEAEALNWFQRAKELAGPTFTKPDQYIKTLSQNKTSA
jgi:DNA-binding response OmpR family regulator